MGKVIVKAKVENYGDILQVQKGSISQSQVRGCEIEAMIDTGATVLCLPLQTIKNLDLILVKQRNVKTGVGTIMINVYESVRLTILGRDCAIEVFELPDNTPPLIGYVPLQLLDFQIDPKNGKVIPNPEHGEEMILDLL